MSHNYELAALRSILHDTGLHLVASVRERDAARAEIERLRWELATFVDISDEVKRATKKFPRWPTDPIHAATVIAEECGELQKAVLEAVYEPYKNSRGNIFTEVVPTAAMCVRFMESLDKYEWFPALQHEQARAALEKSPTCTKLHDGWSCTKTDGHDGPCSAYPVGASSTPAT
ncbi:MAG: hypothetical protein WCL44_08980 [bacterium]